MTDRRSPFFALIALAVAVSGLVIASPAAAQTAPGAPTNLAAAVDGTTLSLSWSAPASGGAPTGYTLLARVTPAGAVLGSAPLGNVTSFTATAPIGTYILSLVATNAAGSGPESATVTVTLPTVPAPPGPPDGFTAVVAGDAATFNWNPPSSGGPVGSYVLQAGLSANFVAPLGALALPASSTTLTLPGIPAGTFYLRVAALNSGGASAPSNEAAITVSGPAAPDAPTLDPASGSGNTLNLSWTPGGGGLATSYVLTALTAGGAVLGSVPLTGTSASFAGVPNGTYGLRLVAVNAMGASPASNTITVTLPITGPPPPIAQIGSDLTSPDGYFGYRMALSADGQRVVVGAFTTTNGTTRVFQRSGSTWTQLGGDIIGEASGDRAGIDVDINATGTRIAVGAYLNDGGGGASGSVRVYDLVGSTWTQVGADLDGSGNSWGAGYSVALSGDGNRVVVGAPGVNSITGRMRVYQYAAGAWTPLGQVLQGTNEFATDVDISADGTTIAASFPSAAGSSRAGTVAVYRLSAGVWTQVGNTMQGEQIVDRFGESLALSADGSRLAVSAPSDKEGGQAGGGSTAGKVRVFQLSGATWTQLGNDILGTPGQQIGTNLQISGDGSRLIFNATSFSLARVYAFAGGVWSQIGADVKVTNGTRADGVAMSADGRTIALGFVYGSPHRVALFSVAP